MTDQTTPDREPIEIELDRPLSFPGQETIHKLTIRPFTGKDLIECGMPFKLVRREKEAPTEEINPKACALLLARMACVPVVMIERMAAVDFFTATEALRIFFLFKSPADRTPERSSINTPESANGSVIQSSFSA